MYVWKPNACVMSYKKYKIHIGGNKPLTVTKLISKEDKNIILENSSVFIWWIPQTQCAVTLTPNNTQSILSVRVPATEFRTCYSNFSGILLKKKLKADTRKELKKILCS